MLLAFYLFFIVIFAISAIHMLKGFLNSSGIHNESVFLAALPVNVKKWVYLILFLFFGAFLLFSVSNLIGYFRSVS